MTELEEYYQQTFQITNHPETRGWINEKTISIRLSGFVLTYGERSHRKQFSRTTDEPQSVLC